MSAGLDEVFRALGDSTRRDILRLLRSEDRTAGEIAGHFLIARSTLSGHFNVLKDAGLVVTERRGTTIVYSLNVSVYEETVAMVMEVLGVREGFLPKGESRSRDDDAYEPAE